MGHAGKTLPPRKRPLAENPPDSDASHSGHFQGGALQRCGMRSEPSKEGSFSGRQRQVEFMAQLRHVGGMIKAPKICLPEAPNDSQSRNRPFPAERATPVLHYVHYALQAKNGIDFSKIMQTTCRTLKQMKNFKKCQNNALFWHRTTSIL
jgi:hypothetical protein